MTPTTYQKPEIRDSNDNIIQQGAFGKNTALSNATNDGWIDYVANDLEALNNNKADANAYLPLTGGTMSGKITKNGVIIQSEGSTGDSRIYGGTTSVNGANLWLLGSDSGGQGRFDLSSSNGSTNHTLRGSANGTLTWDGDHIPVIGNNAGGHNSVYRGKNLGTSVTAAQYAEISAGTFRDMYIGDYWVINGLNWRIAAFDYWLNTGDTNCTTHHVVIVPDSPIVNCQMNSTNTTNGAYVGSDYYTGANDNTGRATAQTAINNAFGSAHILSHRELLANAVTNGFESGGSWYDSTFELMTEEMVYGGIIYQNVINGTSVPYNQTIDKSQLPLFALEPSRMAIRQYWWLRSVGHTGNFTYVAIQGGATAYSASLSLGVRPAFGIKA